MFHRPLWIGHPFGKAQNEISFPDVFGNADEVFNVGHKFRLLNDFLPSASIARRAGCGPVWEPPEKAGGIRE